MNQASQETGMTTNEQRNEQKQPGQDQQGQQNAQRSENLLPTDGADDGRFEVAEEVSLDEQSDTARRVGKAPAGATLDAMGDALRPDGDEDDAGTAGGA
jgi:hypothetical protein